MVTDLYAHADTEDRRLLAQKVEQSFFQQSKTNSASNSTDELVVHPDRKQTIFRAEFPHGFVVVLDGRQPACVLRLAMRKFHSDLWSAF